ncbi:spermatid-specific manchette-related protein 1 [Dryobates pubescens]|uniref:spermatid-specific manchette-related protein 1 n=1 Tax=Dryobates pubescens TaxID=118200 RepID=UPI0023B88984|nr:spermatid-specific manchette-related protein 1 [Dryobates pubescens]
MFLFSKKLKTPVSTYTDSYRPPCSVRKPIKQCVQPLWRENTFVTEGLTVPPVHNPSSQGQIEQLIQAAAQAYDRNLTDLNAYRPEKYWLDRSEEKYNPIFIKEDKYATWRTGSYNSAAWNKHSSYLPLLPKETRMENFLHSIPVPYIVKPTYLSRYDKEVVNNMLHKVPVYTVMGRGPLQGYYSPCSGRHYCLRGLDYYVDGTSARRHLYRQGEKAEYSVLQLQPQSNVLCIYTFPPAENDSARKSGCLQGGRPAGSSSQRWQCQEASRLLARLCFGLSAQSGWVQPHVHCSPLSNHGSQKQIFCCSSSPGFHPLMADNFICLPRWNTSHFMKLGGVQRGSYVIHPEFTSEAFSAPGRR